MNVQFWTPMVLALVVGLALIFIGAMTKSAKPRKKLFWFGFPLAILGAIVILMGSSLPASLGFLSAPLWGGLGQEVNIAYSVAEQPAQSNLIEGKCLNVEDTTVTLSAVDKYLSTAVGGTHRYRVNGADAKTVSDAGTFTASPGDVIEVLWYNASTSGYFSKVGSYTVPCKGTFTPTDDGHSVQLSQNTSLTSTVFNNNDVVMDGAATNISITAGDVKTGKLKLQGAYQKEYPYGFVAVVEFNKSTVDDVILLSNGVELSNAIKPMSYSSTLGTESVTKAYVVPALISNTEYLYQYTIDADDTTSAGAIGSDVLVNLYPNNYFINDKKGGIFEGPSAEDEYNTLTRSATAVITVNVE